MREFTATCRGQWALLQWDEIRGCGMLYTAFGDVGDLLYTYQCDVVGGGCQEPHLRYEDTGDVVDLASGAELRCVADVLLQLTDWLGGE